MVNQAKQAQYLHAMGITPWRIREQHSQQDQIASSQTVSEQHQLNDQQQQAWQLLAAKVRACELCQLHKSRSQVVFGVGNTQADLLIVGEAPGFHEDKQGEPFVGRAGQLLNKMLQAIGLARENVYIGNVLKCRPPENRDPSKQEVAQCTPYLNEQIALLQPKAILAVGRIAAHYLLEIDSPMYQLRGRRFPYGQQQIPLVVSYHPAYLLRNPKGKAKAYQDLLLLQRILESNQ